MTSPRNGRARWVGLGKVSEPCQRHDLLQIAHVFRIATRRNKNGGNNLVRLTLGQQRSMNQAPFKSFLGQKRFDLWLLVRLLV
jgi:hypothetical protein